MFKYNVGGEVCMEYACNLIKVIVLRRWKVLFQCYYDVRNFNDNYVYSEKSQDELYPMDLYYQEK